jgi:predicted unusual protein kinase regulating ubiquinone biosynthesis (AarF/ABC1/UbiB family)
MRDLTYEMRGFYLKQAQLMSIQDDFVPKAYMRWVKDTQGNVPSEFKGTIAGIHEINLTCITFQHRILAS